jgi:hypothetical protein
VIYFGEGDNGPFSLAPPLSVVVDLERTNESMMIEQEAIQWIEALFSFYLKIFHPIPLNVYGYMYGALNIDKK